MADVKISALPASTTPLAGTEVLPIVQSATTRQVSVANLTAGRSVGGTDFIPSGSSAPTNGMYLPTTNSLGFSTNSTERMRIDSSGNVGIGTNSPAAILNVSGALGSSAYSEIARFTNTSVNAGPKLTFYGVQGVQTPALLSGSIGFNQTFNQNNNGQPAFIIEVGNSGSISEKVRVTYDGNLLVGTTSAVNSSKFLVAGVSSANSPVIQGSSSAGAYLNFFNNAQTTGSIQIGQGFGSGSDNVGYLSNNSNADFVFATNGTERMRIDSSGNVGIGTSSPTAPLQVSKGTTGQPSFLVSPSGLTNFVVIPSNSGSTGTQIGTTGADTLGFITNNTERMRIDSSGNLLVGTTTSSAKLTVAASSGDMFSLTTSGTASGYIYNSASASNSDAAFFIKNGNGVGSINCTSVATVFNTASDYRLKENIVPMTGALAKVAQLKPVNYKWKLNGSDGQGFIAHELAEVVPDCVTGEKDAVDANGKPKYQGIDTSFLVATLVSAIQELKAEFDAYKATHP